MTITFRILLLAVAVWTLFYIFRKIRKSRLPVDYAVFWILFSLVLIVMALFPLLCIRLANFLGVVSPANLVFVVIIFILLLRLFSLTLKVAELESKIKRLAAEFAIKNKEEDS